MNQWNSTLQNLARTLAHETGRTLVHLAMLNGQRRTLDWWQDAVMTGIRSELESRDVPQRVAADMLGISVRTYQRHCTEPDHVMTMENPTLWMDLYNRLSTESHLNAIKGWFPGRAHQEISSILRDMVQSGWIIKHKKLYKATTQQLTWSKEMMQAYVGVRKGFGSSIDPDALEQDTGVDRRIWINVVNQHPVQRSESNGLSNIKEVLQGRLLVHRTQVLMLMRHIRDAPPYSEMSAQLWTMPIPPPSHTINHAWFILQVQTFRAQQTAFFKTFLKEINARYPDSKEEDFERWFAWGSLAGDAVRDNHHT